MGALFGMAADLVDMECMASVSATAVRSPPGTTCRADGAEQVCALVALVGRAAACRVWPIAV